MKVDLFYRTSISAWRRLHRKDTLNQIMDLTNMQLGFFFYFPPYLLLNSNKEVCLLDIQSRCKDHSILYKVRTVPSQGNIIYEPLPSPGWSQRRDKSCPLQLKTTVDDDFHRALLSVIAVKKG